MANFFDAVIDGAGKLTRAAFSVVWAVVAVVLLVFVVWVVSLVFFGSSTKKHVESQVLSLEVRHGDEQKNEEKQIDNKGDGTGCECKTGDYCTGPRGGRYCMEDGKKRYK